MEGGWTGRVSSVYWRTSRSRIYNARCSPFVIKQHRRDRRDRLSFSLNFSLNLLACFLPFSWLFFFSTSPSVLTVETRRQDLNFGGHHEEESVVYMWRTLYCSIHRRGRRPSRDSTIPIRIRNQMVGWHRNAPPQMAETCETPTQKAKRLTNLSVISCLKRHHWPTQSLFRLVSKHLN